MALIEACAAGRPVIGTDVGGVSDVVANGVNGYLTPTGDAEALAAAMVRTLSDPEAARRMGRLGRGLVEAKCGVDRLVAEEEALYRRLILARGAAVPVP